MQVVASGIITITRIQIVIQIPAAQTVIKIHPMTLEAERGAGSITKTVK